MDIELFLKEKPAWAFQPCLYIVKQMFEGNNAYRCGLSGGLQFKDSDRVYGADKPGSLSGLLSRMSMYMGFWTPLKGTIYAALRIKAQLVAKPDQRLGEDYLENKININQGNQTLVRVRERDFHDILDRRGLRWDPERRNELFVPGKKGVIELIAAMRQVKGEEMYLFSKDGFIQDFAYRGGSTRESTSVIDTFQKQMQPRAAAFEARIPTITIKLSAKAIEQLQSESPAKFAQLIKIIDAVYKRPPAPAAPTPPPATIRVPRTQVNNIVNGNAQERAAAVENLVRRVVDAPPERRVTRAMARAMAAPRRSARLNPTTNGG
jgi:hypothetical protein